MAGSGFPHCPIFLTAASRKSLNRVSVSVWLILLSDQLRIIGLESLYLTNYLILHRLIQKRLKLSIWYFSKLLGRFLCTTHPFATARKSSPFNLHVLSLPLAFILGQALCAPIPRNVTRCKHAVHRGHQMKHGTLTLIDVFSDKLTSAPPLAIPLETTIQGQRPQFPS